MVQDKLNIASVKSFWMVEAQEALDVTEHLFEKGDYSYALFFGHLAIEKALKALYVFERKEHAPPIHNLTRLAKLAGISLDQDKMDKLILITSFNIEARYPDLKRTFRKKCTKQFTEVQLKIIKEMYKWLKMMLS